MCVACDGWGCMYFWVEKLFWFSKGGGLGRLREGSKGGGNLRGFFLLWLSQAAMERRRVGGEISSVVVIDDGEAVGFLFFWLEVNVLLVYWPRGMSLWMGWWWRVEVYGLGLKRNDNGGLGVECSWFNELEALFLVVFHCTSY